MQTVACCIHPDQQARALVTHSADGGGRGAGGEGRHETGAPRGLCGVCRRTVDHGAGTGVVAGAIGAKSAHRLVTSDHEDVMKVTMHFHN